MFEREASLVLAWRPTPDQPTGHYLGVRARALRGSQTRLIVRARATYTSPGEAVPFWMAWPFVHFGHFLMQRKQLLGIADSRRARRLARESAPLQRDAA